MTWIVIVLGYLLGSVPTGYIAGRLLKDQDIRKLGDGNMGAANVFREIGSSAGIIVGLLDASKGAAAVLIAQNAHVPQLAVLFAGVAAVIGHNWPLFLGFRGGRGESTTIGIFLVVFPISMLVTAVPALLTLVFSKNVVLASTVLFAPLPLVGWWLGVPGILITYGVALPCLVGVTHLLRTRNIVARQV